MLAGPQQSTHQNSYDPTTLRTGLTPGTGLTPNTGLTPLVGGPTSFPPPSPNTAAFLAMVTNSTSNGMNSSAATITPNTLSALSGIVNPNSQSSTNHSQPHPLSVSHGPYDQQQQSQSRSQNQYAYPQQQNDTSDSHNYPQSAATAATTAANGLFLLSQAHQELTKREEAQARAGTLNNGAAKRGAKRKSVDPAVQQSPPSKPAAKKTRSNTRSRKDRMSDSSSEEDYDEEMAPPSGQASNGSKKAETEEEKRRNFLERNRQAALKCRQRKKAWLAQLQAKVEFLTSENERLTSALVSSREEISRLSALVGPGASASVPNGGHGHGPPVSVAVSLAGKNGMGVMGGHNGVNMPGGHPPPAASVTAGGSGRGYGY
ncbi:hypothetical protein SISNIDRAFT_449267 [Sistotremastrum niveocremeum HHB9708]|uniref:BZIP domain-containing protein n=1 Tax=Sistotremastrum niveocremeum HHB9708 TaxID=1314777 RepID=A0A164ZH36_9AGAM|nr:hypothetical protein SISNIDRAFT_449267 [Sistotremastrum niveocremeum HHB9708]